MSSAPKPEAGATLIERLFQKRGAELVQYVRRRIRNDADARDIAQEAYLRFIRVSHPERIENPEAYLYRIAGNLLWEKRLEARTESSEAPAEDILETEHTPFDLTAMGELATGLRKALDKLPALPRAILILHLRDGVTCVDIAAQTGLSPSMVKKHLYNGLALCRRRLRAFKE